MHKQTQYTEKYRRGPKSFTSKTRPRVYLTLVILGASSSIIIILSTYTKKGHVTYQNDDEQNMHDQNDNKQSPEIASPH